MLETYHNTITNEGTMMGRATRIPLYVMNATHANVTALDAVGRIFKGPIQFQADACGGFDTIIDRQGFSF